MSARKNLNLTRVNPKFHSCTSLTNQSLYDPAQSNSETDQFNSDLTYMAYLQAIMKKKVLRQKSAQILQQSEAQLAEQKANLLELKDKSELIEAEIEGLQLDAEIEQAMNDLQSKTESTDVIFQSEFRTEIEDFLKIIKRGENTLLLKNIRPLDEQSYRAFEVLVTECKKNLEKLMTKLKVRRDKVRELKKELAESKASQEEIVEKHRNLDVLKREVECLTIEKMFDSLSKETEVVTFEDVLNFKV